VAELEEDVLEEFQRDVLGLGDPLALRGPLAGGGQLERRPQGVVNLRGDAHPRILTPAPGGGTIGRAGDEGRKA
jgi:hypothetical protein